MIKKRISICCITYNHENFIETAIKSFLSQKIDYDLEILIHDDASTDNTTKIVNDFHNKYPDIIKTIIQEENQFAKGKNITQILISEASGDFIAICEGDDYWVDPLKLQKQVDFLEANPNYSFCWTRFKTLDQSTQELTLDFNDKHFIINEAVIDFDFETSLKGWHVGTQTLVFRSSCFDIEIIERFKYFKDIHLIAQLLKKGKGACLNFVGAVYRIHDGGFHSSVSAFEGYLRGYQCHKEIYLDNKKNIFLKKKYLLSFQNYINALIRENKLLKGFTKSIELFFVNWSLSGLIFNFVRIVKRGFKNLL